MKVLVQSILFFAYYLNLNNNSLVYSTKRIDNLYGTASSTGTSEAAGMKKPKAWKSTWDNYPLDIYRQGMDTSCFLRNKEAENEDCNSFPRKLSKINNILLHMLMNLLQQIITMVSVILNFIFSSLASSKLCYALWTTFYFV